MFFAILPVSSQALQGSLGVESLGQSTLVWLWLLVERAPTAHTVVSMVPDYLSTSHLKAILIWHELLSFPLICWLQEAPWGLRVQLASSGPIIVFCQVQVSHLYTDLITHDVLQLESSKGKSSGNQKYSSPCHTLSLPLVVPITQLKKVFLVDNSRTLIIQNHYLIFLENNQAKIFNHISGPWIKCSYIFKSKTVSNSG